MKMRPARFAGICGSLTMLIALGCDTKKSDEMTRAEAKSIASDAWVFGMPLVYIDKQIDVQTDVSKPQGPLAPNNQFSQYRTFPDASNRSIVGLNVDTLSSLAALDLTHGPILLTVPEMGKRFWVMQLIDAWNNVFGAPGSRTVGEKGGNFAIVGPDWKGSLPELWGLAARRRRTATPQHLFTEGNRCDGAEALALADFFLKTHIRPAATKNIATSKPDPGSGKTLVVTTVGLMKLES
jgi:hypothetical protein